MKVQHSSPPDLRVRYWRRAKKLTAWSLAIGFFATFTVVYFARELAQISVFGWPLSFYMAAQGLGILYLALVVYYAIAMREYDKILHGGGAHGE